MQLDTSILDMLHDLGSPGEPSPVDEILAVFAEDGRQVLQRLLQAARAGDAEATRRAAHRLKGSSANVGGAQLASMLASIEHEAPNGVTSALLARVEAVPAGFEATLQALQAYEPKRSR